MATGAAHPCAVYVCGAFDDRYCDCPVCFMYVKPLMTGSALLLCGRVFKCLRQPGAAPCTSIIYLALSSPTP